MYSTLAKLKNTKEDKELEARYERNRQAKLDAADAQCKDFSKKLCRARGTKSKCLLEFIFVATKENNSSIIGNAEKCEKKVSTSSLTSPSFRPRTSRISNGVRKGADANLMTGEGTLTNTVIRPDTTSSRRRSALSSEAATSPRGLPTSLEGRQIWREERSKHKKEKEVENDLDSVLDSKPSSLISPRYGESLQASNSELQILLKRLRMGMFYEAFEKGGYDSLEQLKNLNNAKWARMVEYVGLHTVCNQVTKIN